MNQGPTPGSQDNIPAPSAKKMEAATAEMKKQLKNGLTYRKQSRFRPCASTPINVAGFRMRRICSFEFLDEPGSSDKRIRPDFARFHTHNVSRSRVPCKQNTTPAEWGEIPPLRTRTTDTGKPTLEPLWGMKCKPYGRESTNPQQFTHP